MDRVAPEIASLEDEARRIVGMICSETVPDAEIDVAVSNLRSRTSAVFQGAAVFEATYGRRFRRLRTWFRPEPGLFAPAG